MPPSRHSSSSHHSSSRSHHSSHSSHSSYSSHRSSSSYGSSYRSSSSSYGSYRSSNPTKTVTTKVPRDMKPRKNQPTNYTGKRAKHEYRCKTHDYIYYGENWTDSTSGKYFERGYYDEAGNRYDQLIIDKPDGSFESLFECAYCGTSTKQVWTEGAIPHCENCGANLIESMGPNVIHDVVDDTMVTKTSYQSNPGGELKGCLAGFMKVIAVIGIFFGGIFGLAMCDESEPSTNKTIVNTNLELFGESIYVESIDRTLKWDEESDSYYDPVSDCYVWYDTDDEPAVWQYWYEDISSDFGDYGWMEYEMDEDQWYIEKSEDNWIELPSEYDTSDLWYITGDLAGTSYSQDYNLEFFGKSIKIDGGTKSYLWDEEYGGYYVKSEDCYVRVNFDVTDPTPQYWYEDISSKYMDKDGYGGWLEYDYGEDCWYVYDQYGDWNKLDEKLDLWHIESTIEGFTGTEIDVNKTSSKTNSSSASGSTFESVDTYPYVEDYSPNKFFVLCYLDPRIDGYFDFDKVKLIFEFDEEEYEVDQFAPTIEENQDILENFRLQEKDNTNVTSLEELKKLYYASGNRMDVTDWFHSQYIITDVDGNQHTYDISKVEVSLMNYYYEGDKRDYYDDFGEQYIVDDTYIFVQGVEFIFYFEE